MDVRSTLNGVFHRVFENPDIEISDEMTAQDVPEWDSLAHISLIVEIEEEFAIKLNIDDIAGLKNVGEMIAMIELKTVKKAG
jgi:acyl carrier protein